MMPDEATRAALSTLTGYASICAWLCAQLPQVVKTYRIKSVEGLALPFLVSWLAGDVTNLVGCVLTDQLPFQTYLAVYFVLVDLTLTGQYMYYSRVNPPPPLPPLGIQHKHVHHLHHHHSRPRSSRQRSSRTVATGSRARSTDNDMTASWTSHVQPATETTTRSRAHSDATTADTPVSYTERGRSLYRHPHSASHSNVNLGQPNHHHQQRQPLFGPGGLETIAGSPASGGIPPEFALLHHQNQHRIALPPQSGPPSEDGTVHAYHAPSSVHERTSSSRSRPPPPSRRSTTGLVLLSVGLFVSFTRLPVTSSSTTSWSVASDVVPSLVKRAVEETSPSYDLKRFIGRANAWICTALYLTSRLPQIWQNSVEGLALMLFVMAFLGNLLYVFSILINPLVTSPGYLQESTPYLLGSGGTLLFDCTVVIQSYLYSSKRMERKAARRRLMLMHDTKSHPDIEEAAALLQSDMEHDDHDGADDGYSRTMSRSASMASVRRDRNSRSRARVPVASSSVAVALSKPHRHSHTHGSRNSSLASSPEDGYSVGRTRSSRASMEDGPGSGYGSRSRTRASSVEIDLDITPIPEAGESSVTARD